MRGRFQAVISFAVGTILLSGLPTSRAQTLSSVPHIQSDQAPVQGMKIFQWVGKRVQFLPSESPGPWKLVPSLPEDVKADNPDPASVEAFEEENATYAEYSNLSGETGQIVSVKTPYSGSSTSYDVTVELNSGLRYRASTHDGQVRDLLFLDELDAAKRLFLNKTWWFFGFILRSEVKQYSRPVNVPRYSAVKITSIAPGIRHDRPLRLTVETAQGKQGYIDVAISSTNGGSNNPLLFDKFQNNFLDYDPKRKYPLTPAIWTAIAHYKVVKGMPPVAVVLSRGIPNDVKKPQQSSKGDLVYAYSFENSKEKDTDNIYFRNGVVVSEEAHSVVAKAKVAKPKLAASKPKNAGTRTPRKPDVNRDLAFDKNSFGLEGDLFKKYVGDVVNRSPFTYAISIKVRFLDDANRQIGTGLDYTEDLPSGAIWHFSIPAPSDAKIVKIIEARGRGQ